MSVVLVNKNPPHSTFGVCSPGKECSACEGLPQREISMSKDYFADNVSIDIWLIHISRGYRISCEIINYF